MRFSVAWAKVAVQNVTLKVATVTLALVSIVQLFVIVTLTARDLPVIERGCFSRTILSKSLPPSQDEIKAFLLEALPMRFDSTAYLKDGFLSLEELGSREKEQTSLKQKQITQRIVILSISVTEKEINAVADRLIEIGKLKSALAFNLKITVQQTNRSEANPYGLVLSTVSQNEENDQK